MSESVVYRCTNLIISICVGENIYDVGTVEGVDIDLGYNGKLELYYGEETPKHCVGGKIASFSLSRWFYADEGQEDLLLDLYNNKTVFNLRGSLADNNGVAIPHTSIVVTECRLYKYKPLTGKADDIIGEEARGFGTDWVTDVHWYPTPISFDEPLDWGYFKRQGEIWFWDPCFAHGGGYFPPNEGQIWFWEPEGSKGGGYFFIS
jgi:hypothetical protein